MAGAGRLLAGLGQRLPVLSGCVCDGRAAADSLKVLPPLLADPDIARGRMPAQGDVAALRPGRRCVWHFAVTHLVVRRIVPADRGASGVSTTSQQPSSLQAEFMKCLFLSCSSPDSLLPQQIDLVERLIDDVADNFVLSHEPDSRSSFVYDLGGTASAGRLVAGWWLPGACVLSARAWRRCDCRNWRGHSTTRRQSPLRGYSYVASAASLRSVLQHLLFYWSMTPPERRGSVCRRLAG